MFMCVFLIFNYSNVRSDQCGTEMEDWHFVFCSNELHIIKAAIIKTKSSDQCQPFIGNVN